ncbi:hypothetical protein BDW74DRAFT_154629 [Aspergillus multicolor]|uniref:uncharacterized protein n=1 Tax=Aspergillus multicolor TaxID=41759 RepID=UPI003CCE3D5A
MKPLRSHAFRANKSPLQGHEPSAVSGPIPFLNPTRAHFHLQQPHTDASVPQPVPRITRLWRSRDNRKGRHAIQVQKQAPVEERGRAPRKTSHPTAIYQGILRMLTTFPAWDISFCVAFLFTLGSVIWVVNAFFVWLPVAAPSTEFAGEVVSGGGITAFIGATVFEVGSILLVLEAVNEDQSGCFGWALLEAEKEAKAVITHIKPDLGSCVHHHADHRRFLGAGQIREDAEPSRSFKWVPTLTELRTHYLHELGFWASAVQFIGATIFWIAGFTGLPGIIGTLSPAVENGVYWVPQIVGGSCFILSGLLFTLETQTRWCRPAFHVLGWHIGFWNTVGGIGFTLCGCLGPAAGNSGVEYQSTLATFWGSWAFLLGSVVQWYESLEKHPVEEK